MTLPARLIFSSRAFDSAVLCSLYLLDNRRGQSTAPTNADSGFDKCHPRRSAERGGIRVPFQAPPESG